jgi:hypothetical protein
MKLNKKTTKNQIKTKDKEMGYVSDNKDIENGERWIKT